MKSFKICLLAILTQLFVAGIVLAGTVPPDSTIFPGQTSVTLINSLVSIYKTSSALSDADCRDTMYAAIDIEEPYDSVRCVYSAFAVYLPPEQDPSIAVYQDGTGINCEHTWPDAFISGIAERDIHHLFPTKVNVNGARSNFPFKEIPDAETDHWYRYSEDLTSLPLIGVRDQYSEFDNVGYFEVREDHKGNTARAMYYMLTMYQLADTSADSTWWYNQKDNLYTWHVNDPADSREITRTKKIATYQQNKPNPFVLDSTLIRRAYFPTLGVGGNPGAYVPDKDRLYQNSPNPFRGHTTIRYELKTIDPATIEIYNLLGQKVNSMALNVQSSGSSKFDWNGTDQAGRMLPPGIYFYRLSVKGKTVDLKRMIMLK